MRTVRRRGFRSTRLQTLARRLPHERGLPQGDQRDSAGKVAPYSVVSEVVRGDGHGSQKVAGLAANDTRLRTAHRVIKIDRSIAAGFRWPDGRMGGVDEARELLEAEGVGFDVHGRVRREFILGPDELREHYEAQQD